VQDVLLWTAIESHNAHNRHNRAKQNARKKSKVQIQETLHLIEDPGHFVSHEFHPPFFAARPISRGCRSSRRNSEMHPALSVDGLLMLNLFGGIGATMRRKLLVALQREVLHHRIERYTGGLLRKFEPPATFGATETPQCDSSIHASLHLMDASIATLQRAPACMKARNVQLHHQRLLPHRVLPHWSRKRPPTLEGRTIHRRMRKVYFCRYWMVCRASYMTGRSCSRNV